MKFIKYFFIVFLALISFSSAYSTLDTWTTLSNMPYTGYYQGASTIGNNIYVYGGYDTTFIASNYLYNVSSDSYTSKTGMPVATTSFGYATLGDSYFVISGQISTGYTNIVRMYNTTTNSWTTKANYPMSIKNMACTSDEVRYIYCFNGYDTANVNNAYKYDITTNSWSALTNVPFSVRAGVTYYYEGLVYLAGGYLTSSSSNYFYSYNVTSNSYTALTSLPANRNGGGIIVGDGSLWYAGGSTGTAATNVVYKYNISANSWTTATSMNLAKYSYGSTTYNGTLYTFGGYTASGTTNNVQKYEAFIPLSPIPDLPTLTIDTINLVNNTITNQSILNINLNLTNTSTNGLVNTTLYLSNSSNYQIGTNTLNVDYNLTMNEGSYNLWTYSFNNETNVTSSNYSYIFDFTAPTIDIIGNITQTDFEVNFSTIFNVTDALSGLASCTINITYLENVTNASQYDSFINCTDTQIFEAVGLYNGFVEAEDNAGNINTLSVNGTIEPVVYVNFLNSTGSNITNYNAVVYHPSGATESYLNTSNPVEIRPVYSGSLDLGTYIIQFSKFGYITQNVTIDINETSGGEEYNFTIGAANIIVNIYDRTTGSLLSGPSIDINILGLSNITTTTGQALFQSFSFDLGTYSVQAISSGYYTEQKDFYYSGQANATINLYLLEQNLTTSSTLYVPVTDEWDNIISGSDTRLLEYDSSIFGFKEVSQCYTDSNGECRFLVEVGLKTYIITTQKTINGVLYQAQSSEEGEIFLPELSGGEEILGRDIIRNLKLQITDTLVTPDFYGLFINSPDTENETITSENSTSKTVEIPISFTATDNLAYTVCLEVYRFTNTTMNSVISPICTTVSSGIIPTTPISLNKDYDYQFWITAESGNNDKITYKKYYYLSSTSFFETLKNKHYVNPVIMLFWVILLAVSLYLKSINIWVWGAWSLSILQLSLFPGVIFASATVTIILINAGVLYMSKRTGDST